MSTAPPSSRDKILEVSEALFAQRGFAGVGMREVAEAAGLGKSSLFHHFRTKAQLYYEVVGRALESIQQRLAAALARGGDPLERLERCVDALVDALAEQPTVARLLLRRLFEDHDVREPPPEAAAGERALHQILSGLEALLREGVASGVFRPVSVPDTVQTLIGASVYHFASGEIGEALIYGPIFSAEAVRRRKHELRSWVRNGIAAPSGGGNE